MLKSAFFIFSLVLYSTHVGAVSAPFVGADLNGSLCTGVSTGHGPFDYVQRNNFKHDLYLVEMAHFTPDVEYLVKGNTSEGPMGDLNYTLRAWPNHHRALLSAIRLQLAMNKKLTKYKIDNPPECYLQRAIHFNPQDPVIYTLYGYYLQKIGKLEDAVKYYEKAIKINPINAKTAYSFSLLLIELKRYDQALKYAKVAYQQHGHPPMELKHKLEKLGVWKE
jgi:tetratricopeptide (TPR) repeat protein